MSKSYLKLTFFDNGSTKETLKRNARKEGLTVSEYVSNLVKDNPNIVHGYEQKNFIARGNLYNAKIFFERGANEQGLKYIDKAMEVLSNECIS